MIPAGWPARLRPGTRSAYERLLHKLIAAATNYPGHLDAVVLRPGQSSQDYVVIFFFSSGPLLQAWMESAERRALMTAITPLTERIDVPATQTGLETWFNVPGESAPSVFCMAPVVWLGIFPIALATATLFRPLLIHLPVVPRVMLAAAVQVTLLTWVIMPVLSRTFRRWLYR